MSVDDARSLPLVGSILTFEQRRKSALRESSHHEKNRDNAIRRSLDLGGTPERLAGLLKMTVEDIEAIRDARQ